MGWDAPVSEVRGVGPARAGALARRGVRTLQDLLFLVPQRYRQPAPFSPVADAVAGERLSVVGWVRARRRGRLRRRGGNYLELGFEDEGGTRVRIRFYNQAWLFDRMPPGSRLLASGALSRTAVGVMVADHWALLEEEEDPAPRLDALLPVLPTVAGVAPGTLSRLVADALGFAEALGDPLPETVRDVAAVAPLPTALRAVHFPQGREAVEAGGVRLLFDRMLALALPMAAARGEEGEAPALATSPRTLDRIRARFPFTFTPGQDAALAAVLEDLDSGRPMRRLLQGDVGSGKTAVALAAALAVIAGHRQVLFLAPTEPLAHQHRRVLARYLEGSQVATALYTARSEASERRRVEQDAESGSVDLVIATHAALSSRLAFKDLGLVVIDEQQRFGVRQRLLARAKGSVPHVLAMSATPIPRSLCLALMGDLDRTVIPDRPRGRDPVVTHVDGGEAAFQAVRDAVERGERAFIVLPAINADEMPALSREGAALVGNKGPLRGIAHRFLHGQLPSEERDSAFAAFASGGVPLLLATVMVEVGIDVPEATVMVVLGAERFGLAGLHQLRGRVGRGERSGTCWLLPSGGATEAARERLSVLERESDGFEIAEADLRLRGPGEILGVRQAGAGGRLLIGAGADRDLLDGAIAAARQLADDGVDVSFWEHLGSSLVLPMSLPEDAV